MAVDLQPLRIETRCYDRFVVENIDIVICAALEDGMTAMAHRPIIQSAMNRELEQRLRFEAGEQRAEQAVAAVSRPNGGHDRAYRGRGPKHDEGLQSDRG
jgi:hypothetical protein